MIGSIVQLSILLLIILSLGVYLIIKTEKKDEKVKRSQHIIILIILISLFLGALYLFKNQYLNRFNYGNNKITSIDICFDSCTTIELTSVEQKIFNDEVDAIYFEKRKSPVAFIFNWSDSRNIETRSAVIEINNNKLYYQYVRFLDKGAVWNLCYRINKTDYVHSGENKITQIIDRYLIENKEDIIDN